MTWPDLAGPGLTPVSRKLRPVGEGVTMAQSTTSMAAVTRPATEEDLLQAPRDGRKHELVDGEIRVSPAGQRHGQVCVRLLMAIGAFVRERKLGELFDSSTGFRLSGGNVRVPDVSFESAERSGGRISEGFGDGPPDLAVEVLSPEDRPRQVLDKVGEYLEAGVRLVWVIDPRARRAVVYRSLTDVRELGIEDSLDGEDTVPGFRCTLREILE